MNGYTHITFVLDRSGSMTSVRDDRLQAHLVANSRAGWTVVVEQRDGQWVIELTQREVG